MVLLLQSIGVFWVLVCLDGLMRWVFAVCQWIFAREEVFEVDVSEN